MPNSTLHLMSHKDSTPRKRVLGMEDSHPFSVCVCESYIGKPIGTRAVPQFTTGVAKPLTQIEPGKN